MRRFYRTLLPLILLTGCDALGLGDPTIDGTWLMSARNLSAGTVTCRISGLVLDIRQSGDRFTGSANDGELACVRDDTLTYTADLGTEPIVSGRIRGDSVSFDIGSIDWHNVALLRDRSMTGTLVLRYGAPIGATPLTGAFGAARLDTLP